LNHDRIATLQQLVATIQRRWGTRALRLLGDALPQIPNVAAIPTGFPELDAVLAVGGVPRGGLTELLGMPTAGMTTIALTLIAHAQATGDLAGYIDLSHTFDAEYAALVGVDLATLLLVRPSPAGDALEIMQALVGSGGVGVLVVDSLALMQSNPRDAMLLAQALRVLPGTLARSPCALLVLTALPYSPDMTRALGFSGSLLAHAATIRLHIAREAWLPHAHGAPGCHARVSVLKHKFAPVGGDAQVLVRFPERIEP
jgi:protein RecA